MEDDPFPGLILSSSDILDNVDTRQLCLKCLKSRKYFCYTCLTPLPSIAGRIPELKLPFNIHVIKHPNELDGKSTAVHAAILAPLHVTVFEYPNIPDYTSTEHVVLLFPGVNSCPLRQYVLSAEDNSTADVVRQAQTDSVAVSDSTTQCTADTVHNLRPLDTVVFIDCTWYQVHKIATDPRLTKLQRIELTSHETKFWRHQLDKPSTYLSTIEAIYYCVREYYELNAEHGLVPPYSGQFDDLLFFFVYFYRKIHAVTNESGRKLKAYHGQRRKTPRTIHF